MKEASTLLSRNLNSGRSINQIADVVVTEKARKEILDDIAQLKKTQGLIIVQADDGRKLFSEAFDEVKSQAEQVRNLTREINSRY